MLIPVSESPVFDGVEDDEGLENRVTETGGTAELVPGRWVKDCVDISSLDVTIPFSKISSSPILLDANEGIEVVSPEVEFESTRCEMVDDGSFSKASSSPLVLWDVDEGIGFDVPEVDCEVISCVIVNDGLFSKASSSSLVLLDADGELGVDVPEVEFEASSCEMVDDGFFRKASSSSTVLWVSDGVDNGVNDEADDGVNDGLGVPAVVELNVIFCDIEESSFKVSSSLPKL